MAILGSRLGKKRGSQELLTGAAASGQEIPESTRLRALHPLPAESSRTRQNACLPSPETTPQGRSWLSNDDISDPQRTPAANHSLAVAGPRAGGRRPCHDIVQETAIQTMTVPPKRSGPAGGWLATVVRNLASKHQRAERIRHRHEAKAARAEVAPPDRSAEDADTLRRLTEIVTSLPEQDQLPRLAQ